MFVNTVSLGNAKQSFRGMGQRERFAGLSDDDLRQIAYKKASKDVNDKKHRKLNNILYYSIPLAAGVASALTKPATRVGRLMNFGFGFASWAVPFAIVDTVIGAKHATQNIVPSIKDFNEKHPILSGILTLGASIAAYMGITRGGIKYLSKHGKDIAKKALPYTNKLEEKLNNSKVLNNISKLAKKIPSSAKGITKSILDWSPWILLFTNISHSVNHEKVKAREFVNNYEYIKDKQEQVRQDLANQSEEVE